MKNIFLAFLALPFLAFSQNEKGVSPLANPKSEIDNPKSTRAVVIGISDYQEKDIPDLRFADKDAEAFANFLRSPAGGSLDGDHLQVLTNQNATAGRVAEALDALVEQTKEGDQVIIYFSGHGDVERKIFSQPGFLLCWDAPARVYMGGGTYSLSFLEAVVTTLSVQNKAVTVITDAGLGMVKLDYKEFAEAERDFKKALACDSTSANIWGWLGRVYLAQNRAVDAKRVFEKAVQMDSTFFPVRFNLGVANLRLGRFEEAGLDFQKAIQLRPKDERSYRGMACVSFKTGTKAQEALGWLEKSIQKGGLMKRYLPTPTSPRSVPRHRQRGGR